MNTLVITIQPDDPEKYWLIPNITQAELAMLWELSHADLAKDVLPEEIELQLQLFEAALGAEHYEYLPTYCKWKDFDVKPPIINTNIQHVFVIIYPEY